MFNYFEKKSGPQPDRSNLTERGATMLEAALVLPLFILVLVVSFDLLRLGYNLLTIRYVTTAVMRQATIGNMNAGQISAAIVNLSGSLATPLQAGDVSMCPLANYPCPPGITVGTRGELMVLEVRATPGSLVLGGGSQFGLTRRDMAVAFRVIGRFEP